PKELIELAAERPYLTGSDLAESAQRVRLTPTVMDIDETSKLWGMLHQTPYTLSVAYQASLVLIEGRERPAPVKPVERRTVRAQPFGAAGAPVPPGAPGTAPEPAPQPAPAPAPEPALAGEASVKRRTTARAAAPKKTAARRSSPRTRRSTETDPGKG
ncbi:Pvc16 family protein, partial [Streptomyces jumonjinensis]